MSLSKNERVLLAIVVGLATTTSVLGVAMFTLPTNTSTGNTSPPSTCFLTSTMSDPNVSVGDWPSAVLFDPINQLVYVTVENSSALTVVNPCALHVAASIPFNNSRGLALDPATGQLFVSNGFGDDFMVVDTANNSEVGTYALSGYTYLVGAQFDSTTGQLFFLANNNDAILSVSSCTYTLVKATQVQPNTGGGTGPIAGVDPQTGVMYYAARGSMGVDLIGELNGTVFGFFPTGASAGPTNTFYDPYNQLLYVALGGWMYTDPGNQVVVLNATTGVPVANMTVGQFPSSFAYDSSRHLLFVSNADSGTISVINDTTNRVVDTISLGLSSLPGGIAIDPSTGSLFVAEDGTGLLAELPPA